MVQRFRRGGPKIVEKSLGRRKWEIPQLVDVSALKFLMIDGHGDPNSKAFEVTIRALYTLAYKQQLGRYYVMPPLEGLWWADDMYTFTTARDKS